MNQSPEAEWLGLLNYSLTTPNPFKTSETLKRKVQPARPVYVPAPAPSRYDRFWLLVHPDGRVFYTARDLSQHASTLSDVMAMIRATDWDERCGHLGWVAPILKNPELALTELPT